MKKYTIIIISFFLLLGCQNNINESQKDEKILPEVSEKENETELNDKHQKQICCEKFGYGSQMKECCHKYEWMTEEQCLAEDKRIGGGRRVVENEKCD